MKGFWENVVRVTAGLLAACGIVVGVGHAASSEAPVQTTHQEQLKLKNPAPLYLSHARNFFKSIGATMLGHGSHSSHSSHGSHASHASHVSGTEPPRYYPPSPPPYTPPSPPANYAPVANNLAVKVAEDGETIIRLKATDANGDPLEFSIMDFPEHGTLTAKDLTSAVYKPDAGFTGKDSFTYRAYDGSTYSEPATVTITVTLVNDAPIANDLKLATPLDTARKLTLKATDPEKAKVSYKVTRQPKHGKLSGTAPALTYTPDSGYVGSDSFTYTASDGELTSTEATVSIEVGAANHAPIAADMELSAAKNGSKELFLSATDRDGDQLTFRLVDAPQHGRIGGDPTTGDITYKPDNNFSGTDSFTFVANDGQLDSNIASVSIQVGRGIGSK